MNQLGIGPPPWGRRYIGRKITSASLDREGKGFLLGFDGGVKIAIWDRDQLRGGSRYMTTDDDLASLIGHTLTRIDAKGAPNEPTGSDAAHEMCFIEIGTDKGFITLVNHNEHNGCYSGFNLAIDEVLS